ncbi:MAG: hypothetical protein K2L48_01875 [Mycoplasmoidaceae bacterium]|nr:hypothetical protein [Mycoplasmoidaceae bacterium]
MTFLCNPIHKYNNPTQQIASSGIEAVAGKNINQVDNKEFSIALVKVSLNLNFEL